MLIAILRNWVLLLLSTSFASAINLLDALQAQDLAISSVNLNARLSWTIDSNIVTSKGNDDVYEGDLVTYTVEVYDSTEEEGYKFTWMVVPGCVRVQQRQCKLHVPSVGDYEYRVQTNLRNRNVATSDEYLYDFYNDPLLPPKFSVLLNYNYLLLQISEIQTVNWGDQSLFDFYKSDGILLHYKIEYWIMPKDSSNISRLKIERKADVAKFEFPVERKKEETICVRLAVEENIGTVKGDWSSPVCVSESAHEWHIMIAVLCGLFLVAIAVLTWIVRKRIHKFLKRVRLPLPKELAIVVEDLEKHRADYSSASLEAECVTAYQCSQGASTQQVDDEKAVTLGEPHAPVVVNKYVPMKRSESSLPALHSLVPSSEMISDGDISDYVGIPSPDSGVGMIMNFEPIY